jgi:hypothetical protein
MPPLTLPLTLKPKEGADIKARAHICSILYTQGVQDGNFATTERPRHEVRQAKVDGRRVLLVTGENHHQGCVPFHVPVPGMLWLHAAPRLMHACCALASI